MFAFLQMGLLVLSLVFDLFNSQTLLPDYQPHVVRAPCLNFIDRLIAKCEALSIHRSAGLQ